MNHMYVRMQNWKGEEEKKAIIYQENQVDGGGIDRIVHPKKIESTD